MDTSAHSSQRSRTRWGRPRFGGGERAMVALSLGVGGLLSAGVGWLLVVVKPADVAWWVLLLVGTLITLPASSMLAWAIFVDRRSLTGAVDAPEDSVEGHWYTQAAAGAFGDLLAVSGIGAAVFAFSSFDVDPMWVLMGLCYIAICDFGLRYWRLARTEG